MEYVPSNNLMFSLIVGFGYDDMNIIKDAGSGTVIETQEVTNPYNPAGIPRYKVFCHKLCDTKWFYKPYIETFITKGDKNVKN